MLSDARASFKRTGSDPENRNGQTSPYRRAPVKVQTLADETTLRTPEQQEQQPTHAEAPQQEAQQHTEQQQPQHPQAENQNPTPDARPAVATKTPAPRKDK